VPATRRPARMPESITYWDETSLADDVDWRFLASVGIPFAGRYTGKQEVQGWFGKLAESNDVQKFEPREFPEGPNHVTVIGWEQTQVKPNGKVFESDLGERLHPQGWKSRFRPIVLKNSC
jgi:hypothetical protein